MSIPKKMHAHEIPTDILIAQKLITEQFPHFADLPISPVSSWGTDNTIYRLGSNMSIRLPRIESATGQLKKDLQWLSKISPHLPCSIPQQLEQGMPTEYYQFPWAIYNWIEGSPAYPETTNNLDCIAYDLANFIQALHKIDPKNGPRAGKHNSNRGNSLHVYDTATRDALAKLTNLLDTKRIEKCWNKIVNTPPWKNEPVWIHGDLHPANILIKNEKVSGIIDFGCLGVGDPAVDLLPAWTLFSRKSREIFKTKLNFDDSTWQRGKGWALAMGIIALPYYLKTNSYIVKTALLGIQSVLLESK